MNLFVREETFCEKPSRFEQCKVVVSDLSFLSARL